MKRAEERALEVFPVCKVPFYGIGNYSEIDANFDKRALYQLGYEQAEKDTIERAIEWLETNAEKYIVDVTPTYPDAPQELIIGGKCWDELRKAMEE